MGLSDSVELLLYGSKVRSFGQWADANCAAPPTASAGQYATLNCKPLLFEFTFKWIKCMAYIYKCRDLTFMFVLSVFCVCLLFTD